MMMGYLYASLPCLLPFMRLETGLDECTKHANNCRSFRCNMWYTLTSDYSKVLAGIVIFFGYIHLYSMQSISWRDHYSQLQLHISAFSSTFRARAARIIYIYTSTGRKFALVEGVNHNLVCGGSNYHVHFAWQVWHGQYSPGFKFNKLKSFSRVEIDRTHVDLKDSRGKGFALRRLNKHNFCPASVYIRICM